MEGCACIVKEVDLHCIEPPPFAGSGPTPTPLGSGGPLKRGYSMGSHKECPRLLGGHMDLVPLT